MLGWFLPTTELHLDHGQSQAHKLRPGQTKVAVKSFSGQPVEDENAVLEAVCVLLRNCGEGELCQESRSQADVYTKRKEVDWKIF
jgi:hypothetical protein